MRTNGKLAHASGDVGTDVSPETYVASTINNRPSDSALEFVTFSDSLGESLATSVAACPSRETLANSPGVAGFEVCG